MSKNINTTNANATTNTAATIWVANGGDYKNIHPYTSREAAYAAFGGVSSFLIQEVPLLDGPIQESEVQDKVYLILHLDDVYYGEGKWRLLSVALGKGTADAYVASHQTKMFICGYGEVDRYAAIPVEWGPTKEERDELLGGVMRDLARCLKSGQARVL
jgi:hypothetical protein